MATRGHYTENLIPVETNVFHIPERLREIDPGYFVMLNRNSGRFELHHDGNGEQNSFQCTIPFNDLDERAVRHVRRTHIRFLKELLAEMDAENEKAMEVDPNLTDPLKQKSKDLYRYWMNHESKAATVPKDAYTTRFV
jgi:hypothetical protein